MDDDNSVSGRKRGFIVVTSGIETKVLCLGDVVSSDLLGDLAERGCFSIPAIQRQKK